MNDPKEAIRKAYKTALHQTITITDESGAAKTLDFRATVQTKDVPPYIKVIGQTSNGFVTKNSFGTEATITIGVVTKFGGDEGGPQVGDEAIDKITDIVRPDSRIHLDTTADGHRIIITTVGVSNTIEQVYEDGNGYLHTITFSHTLNQL